MILSKEDQALFSSIKNEIDSRLGDFSRLSSKKWIREVCLCLLTPQSSPVSAENAMHELEANGFFKQSLSEEDVAMILRKPKKGGYVRFHLTKAKRLLSFLQILEQVESVIFSKEDYYKQRDTLFKLVHGFGLKEASHALRNIGRTNLAILDRHILRCLAEYKVIEDPKINLNYKNYIQIEKLFLNFSTKNNVTMDQLDLFFWWKATGFIFK